MKKILSTVIAAFCLFAAPLSALEWGGLFSNDSKFTKTTANSFKQSDAVYMWVNTPVFGDWALSAEGMYKFSFTTPGKIVENVADIDLLKLSGALDLGDGVVQIAAGRFFYADNTGVNFAQCSDGVAANLVMSKMNFGFYAGYTGMLNSLNVSILGGETGKPHQFYTTCHSYIPVVASFELPSILGNQSVAFQLEYFGDTTQEKYNRTYMNVTAGGPIIGAIYYSAATSFGFVKKEMMNYTSFSVAAYPTEAIAVNAGIEYASGDSGKKLKPYRTFTSKTAYGAASAPEMTGCIVPTVDVIYTTGPMFANVVIKAPLAMPEKKAKMAGVGADLAFIYNVFSDLQAEVDLGYFKDTLNKGADDNLSAALKFSISF